MNIENVFLNWHGLIKNRKGPYHLVVKNEAGFYYGYGNLKSYENAHHYESCLDGCNLFWFKRQSYNENYRAYLTTSAGDIEVTKANFNSKIRWIGEK